MATRRYLAAWVFVAGAIALAPPAGWGRGAGTDRQRYGAAQGESKMNLKQVRSVESELEIDAPLDAVWKALTDAQELVRWFPLHAKVKPGKGGAIWASWGPPFEGESTIQIWEPNRHLRTGWPFTASGGEKCLLFVDYFLESAGGTTRLRLVHSGFGVGEDWDAEYDGVTRGWAFELNGLRHYLEHHRGKDRRPIWIRKPTKLAADAAAARLIGPEGRVFRGQIDGLKPGDRYRLELVGTNRVIEGVVSVNRRPRSFSGTVPGINNALFRCDIERIGSGEEAWVWFSTYGLDTDEADTLQGQINKAVAEALPH